MNSILRDALLIAFLLPTPLAAQHSRGNLAGGPANGASDLPEPPTVTLPAVDAVALMAEDEERIANGVIGPWRFGINHQTSITMSDGLWSDLGNGDRVWQLRLVCPDAVSIGLVFNEIVVPPGAEIVVHNDAGYQRGPFRTASKGRKSLPVDQIPGERITVVYREPASVIGEGSFSINRVTHAYRDDRGMQRGFGDSDPCQVNSSCPIGDDWRDQIRSVAIINVGGGSCTGNLINNCLNDGTPYFLTANHCLGTPVDTWTFRFNWESPNCDPTEDISSEDIIASAELLANDSPTDFALLRLAEVPPDSFNVFYAGWTITDQPALNVVGIHHPRGDIKKITASALPVVPYLVTIQGNEHDTWHVTSWDVGTTEQGSSGSALFNQDGLIVGQLVGGSGTCAGGSDSYYGRFHLSYPQMAEWLGNCGPNVPGIDYTEVVIPIIHDAAITSIVNIPELICGDSIISPIVTLKNNGLEVMTSAVITYGLMGGSPNVFNWTGSLQVQQTLNVPLPPIVAATGANTVYVTVTWPNANEDQVPDNDTWFYSFNVSNPGGTVQLALTLDNWGSDITWELATQLGTVLYEGGPYPDLEEGETYTSSFCLTNDCYVFTINDAFGDGICCDEGEGSYMIMTSDSTLLVESDGQYGEQEVQTFCVEVVGVPEAALPDFDLYPNPARDRVMLRAPLPIQTVRVLDATGRMMLEERAGSELVDIGIEQVTPGAYLVEVHTAEGRAVKRLVVH